MNTRSNHAPFKIWVIVTAAVLVLMLVFNLACFAVIPKVFENLWGTDVTSGRAAILPRTKASLTRQPRKRMAMM